MVAPNPPLALMDAVRRHWGFDALRPLQAEAVSAAMNRRDSVVVIPTGGGKSLCYQAPAAASDDGLTLVVSPLIALMKDQVDSLRARGISSALYNSSLSAAQRRDVTQGLMDSRFRLLYVAPERFPDESFLDAVRETGVRAVAIDEAHCISHWGHDFRPDYRRLNQLRDWFPDVSIHAFTATAGPRVRDDIIEQLRLRDPVVLVGDFDRPNLTYRVHWRTGLDEQICRIILRNAGKPGIIYCIRRLDVDELCVRLKSIGIRALPYHAGLHAVMRKENQDAFASGKADVIVATVAFGMGIDRADIRYIVHAAMPKSVEAYQQETGRAGRDGLPAECTMFYTNRDFMTWKAIIEMNETEHLDAHIAQLREVLNYCGSTVCRHRLLVEHFGQPYPAANCGACDACLDARPTVPDGKTVAMKILSAVVRTGERFGAKYVADVLTGVSSDNVVSRGHETLSVFGLMREHDPRDIGAWMEQLAAEGFMEIGEEYRTFSLTPKGRELLRGTHDVQLFIPRRGAAQSKRTRRPSTSANERTGREGWHGLAQQGRVNSIGPSTPPSTRRPDSFPREPRPAAQSWSQTGDGEDPMDAALFESLRRLRKQIADSNNLPAYCVVSNKTLECIARVKPADEKALLDVPGIGPKKWTQYGPALLDCVRRHVGR